MVNGEWISDVSGEMRSDGHEGLRVHQILACKQQLGPSTPPPCIRVEKRGLVLASIHEQNSERDQNPLIVASRLPLVDLSCWLLRIIGHGFCVRIIL